MTSKDADEAVIDAEIVSDDKVAHGDADTSSAGSAGVPGTPRSGRYGWITAGVFVIFIGGVIAAPFLRNQLVRAGLVPEPEPTVTGGIAAGNSGLRSEEIADLKEAVSQLKDAFNATDQQLINRLDRLEAASLDPNTSEDTSRVDTQQVAALDAKITQQATDIERLSNALETLNSAIRNNARDTGVSAPRVAALEANLTALAAETKKLQDALDQAKVVIAEQAAQLDAVTAGKVTATPRGRLLVAMLQLKDHLNDGTSYADVLRAMRPDLEDLPPLDQAAIGSAYDQLATYQETGVQTISALRSSFLAMSRDLQADDTSSWWSSLVQVRRTDTSAAGLDATINQVEQHLNTGDLGLAVDRLNRDIAVNNQSPALKDWLEAATSRLAALQAFETLGGRVSDPVKPGASENGAGTL